jgi:hypothetical protein
LAPPGILCFAAVWNLGRTLTLPYPCGLSVGSALPARASETVSNLLLGLGPPRSYQHEAPSFNGPHTDGSPRLFPLRRPPNGVARRFPDWTAVGFASEATRRFLNPGPIPRIEPCSAAVAGYLTRPGSDAPSRGGCCPRGPVHHWRRFFYLISGCLP